MQSFGPRTPRVLAPEPEARHNGRDSKFRAKGDNVAEPARRVSPGADASLWRVEGPLLADSGTGPVTGGAGPLAGLRVAVKDIFAVAGHHVGAGSRVRLAEAPLETVTAPAVLALLRAGATLAGIAQTDQFAYSVAGINPDYGTPPNPAVPGGMPGGSSSGPASAVAMGDADIGLGTDTAGSIRVPASYQGLWGLRTTHGAVSREGVLPLAPRYDTVGWLTRDGSTMLATAAVGLAGRVATRPTQAVVVSAQITASATAEAAAAVTEALVRLTAAGRIVAPREVALPLAREFFEAFRVTQSAQAWREHGAWVDAHPGALGDDVASRFAWAKGVTAEREAEGIAAARTLADAIDAALGLDVLVLPSAASAAPSIGADARTLNALREATLGMTAIAGLTGRPALSVPLAMTDAGPVGVCLVGPRGSDLALIDMAIGWTAPR